MTVRANAVSIGRAKTHARAVAPSLPVQRQPISCTTSLPTVLTLCSSPLPYAVLDATFPPRASTTADVGTRPQNSMGGTWTATVIRLAIGVGEGLGVAFFSSLQPHSSSPSANAA